MQKIYQGKGGYIIINNNRRYITILYLKYDSNYKNILFFTFLSDCLYFIFKLQNKCLHL